VILFDFLSLKNDVNVPSKSIKQKNFMDPQHWCKGGGDRGSQTDKHLPPSTFTGQSLREAEI
jgi:hypothetical protein